MKKRCKLFSSHMRDWRQTDRQTDRHTSSTFNPLTPTVAVDERQSARMSKITNDGLTGLAQDAL